MDEVNGKKEELLEVMESIATISSQASASSENVAGITAEQKQNASLMGHVSERLNSELNQLNEILANIPVDYAPVQRRKIAMVWDLDDPFWYPATKQAYRTAKILNLILRYLHLREEEKQELWNGAFSEKGVGGAL